MVVMSTFGLFFSSVVLNQHTTDNVQCVLHVAWMCANVFNTEQSVGGEIRPLTRRKKSYEKSQTGVYCLLF